VPSGKWRKSTAFRHSFAISPEQVFLLEKLRHPLANGVA